MKARFRGPSGSGTVELPDDATVQDVFEHIRTQTGIAMFTLKYGPPTAMTTLDTSQGTQNAKSTGIHGQSLTIVPIEVAVTNPVPASTAPKNAAGQADKPEDIVVPWTGREGTILLRVMPSDNSCLFTAFGGALPEQIPAQRLRRMMADYIEEHADVYTAAVLGSPVREYCRSIQDPDRWGGGIELSILSAIFDIQICTYDIIAKNLINFGEDKRNRCILAYSGIHYDRIAFTYTEYPHTEPTLPPDMDRTIWPTADNDVLQKALTLVEKLHSAHYYTDTDSLVLSCDVPGCGWIGNGQLAGRKHAEETGHVDLSEIQDVQDSNVLRKCNTAGCMFMGQGDEAVRVHQSDTGHKGFSIIPDF